MMNSTKLSPGVSLAVCILVVAICHASQSALAEPQRFPFELRVHPSQSEFSGQVAKFELIGRTSDSVGAHGMTMDSVELIYEPVKQGMQPDEIAKLAGLLADIKRYIENFLSDVIRPCFSKRDFPLGRKVQKLLRLFKSAILKRRDLFARSDLQLRDTLSFVAIAAHRDTLASKEPLGQVEFSLEEFLHLADIVIEVYTKRAEPDWRINLASIKVNGHSLRSLLEMYMDVFEHIGLGKVVKDVGNKIMTILSV